MKKKLVGLLMAVSMCMGTFSMATPALANTTDRTIDFDVNALNYNVTTGSAKKDGKTPVYVYLTSLASRDSMYVRALGVANSKSYNMTENGTTGSLTDHVTCKQGTQYSVHSQIYEKGYGYAKVAFKSKNAINSERAVGKWSPDSTKTYTHAWQ